MFTAWTSCGLHTAFCSQRKCCRVCLQRTNLRSVRTWMHQTASECQLQISLAMQRNRCTRHLSHKSLGWEKLTKIMMGHSKRTLLLKSSGSILRFSIHLTSTNYTVLHLHTHHESSWCAYQMLGLHVNAQLHTQSIVRNHCEGDNQESQTPQPFIPSLLPTWWSKKL